jgi:Alanine-zipper, major outer membrane lipoprotein
VGGDGGDAGRRSRPVLGGSALGIERARFRFTRRQLPRLFDDPPQRDDRRGFPYTRLAAMHVGFDFVAWVEVVADPPYAAHDDAVAVLAAAKAALHHFDHLVHVDVDVIAEHESRFDRRHAFVGFRLRDGVFDAGRECSCPAFERWREFEKVHARDATPRNGGDGARRRARQAVVIRGRRHDRIVQVNRWLAIAFVLLALLIGAAGGAAVVLLQHSKLDKIERAAEDAGSSADEAKSTAEDAGSSADEAKSAAEDAKTAAEEAHP